ncbi:MAG: type II toxin-antitoxin system VapC family toxin [Planctomycetes bacterium]|nr:type II toxin-antitoxin system VapC family toxin [Planctomycetota bacterium]
MPLVYLETTVVSYLAAMPSRDLIVAAHQQLTHDWWRTARSRFDLYISEAVLHEISLGDPEAVARRLQIVEGIPILKSTEDVTALVVAYDLRLGLTGRARADLVHIAFAVAYELDYLVTWNCRHLAHGGTIRRLARANAELRRFTPIIVTPEELMEPEEEERHD